ncbi:MAG: hypothetical protein ABS934_04225 [Psychrobacillus sp.]
MSSVYPLILHWLVMDRKQSFVSVWKLQLIKRANLTKLIWYKRVFNPNKPDARPFLTIEI